MKTSQLLVVAVSALVTLVQGWQYGNASTAIYTTFTTDVLTTYCPSPTVLTQGSSTYTVTEETTLTITACPCTYSLKVVPTPYSAPHSYPVESISASTPTSEAPSYPTSPDVLPPASDEDSSSVTVASPVWVTETLSVYTTYCPSATTFTHGSQTYTATPSETVTVSECPCTVSYLSTPTHELASSSTTWCETSYTTVTVSLSTSYCPTPTALTYGTSTTYVTVPGYVTIPIIAVSTSTYAVSTVPASTSPGFIIYGSTTYSAPVLSAYTPTVYPSPSTHNSASSESASPPAYSAATTPGSIPSVYGPPPAYSPAGSSPAVYGTPPGHPGSAITAWVPSANSPPPTYSVPSSGPPADTAPSTPSEYGPPPAYSVPGTSPSVPSEYGPPPAYSVPGSSAPASETVPSYATQKTEVGTVGPVYPTSTPLEVNTGVKLGSSLCALLVVAVIALFL